MTMEEKEAMLRSQKPTDEMIKNSKLIRLKDISRLKEPRFSNTLPEGFKSDIRIKK